MKTFLLRKEHFGGTLFSVKSGKRSYLSTKEFGLIKKNGKIAKELARELGEAGDVNVISPKEIPVSGFSFADTVFFELTRFCNLSCTHCFNSSGKKMKGEISFENQAYLIKKCAEFGAQEIRFTGGEPMVLRKIYSLIKCASLNNLRVSMGTNGTLITQKNAKRLCASGLHSAIVSIDGMEKSHDAIRGLGAFQKSINGILNLREQGIYVRINVVAMKQNVKDIPRVAELFSRLGVDVFVRRFIPRGRPAENAADFFLGQDEYGQLRNALAMYLDDPKGHIRGHYLKEEQVASRIQLPFIRRACSAAQRALVIDPCGKIQLCGFLSQKSTHFVGDVLKESLDQIWQRILEERPTECLAKILDSYNKTGQGMKTNCLAIAAAIAYNSR